MVYIKMTNIVSIPAVLFLIILGCQSPNSQNKSYFDVVLPNNLDSINKRYCFSQIRDSLIKSNVLNLAKGEQTTYKKADNVKLLKDRRVKRLSDEVTEFYEFTFFTDSYIMKYQNEELLIMIGQAAGATGIGVDYWNYRCYSLNSDLVIPEFVSLVKTPFSVFIDSEGEIGHLEIEDNRPRPAGGKEVELKYMPLLINVFSGAKKSTIEFKCGNY